MRMNITKQFSILEDTYRLLDYLDWLADNDRLHFQQSGYSSKLERDNALWELKHKIRFLKPHIVDTYSLSFEDITEDEKRNLQKWVADGNSIFENPYCYSDESGRPMDFINACRFNTELYEEHLASLSTKPIDVEHAIAWDDDLPF
jgi:hypothetical protein